MSQKSLNPFRQAFGPKEIKSAKSVINYYNKKKQDPPYNGFFEKKLSKSFTKFMHGGYAKPVSTGTSAIYVALQALKLKKGSEILLSPVNDSGPFNCVIALGYVPKLVDSEKLSYNTNLEEIKKRIGKKTKAFLLTHIGGSSVEIGKIYSFLKKKKIKIIEDCSQAAGASCFECIPRCKTCKNKYVGEFGDIAAFSTMYRKNISSGGSGGIVFTKNKKIFTNIMAYSDRGKKIWKNVNLNDPGLAMFPALNHNTNDFTCAITHASLLRLNNTNTRRRKILENFLKELKILKTCTPSKYNKGFAPFFFPIFVNEKKLKCTKRTFAITLKKQGVGLLEEYNCIISRWKWARKYLNDNFVCKNANEMRKKSFNLFLNENYTTTTIKNIVKKMVLVEKKYLRKI
jgi:dTDP-4-amino-4,6-dideoxygalactose transaminase|tara:strand:+ start:922 stop:2121 length:1200 start_codon:yes stop_codon:yes gene_type:complete